MKSRPFVGRWFSVFLHIFFFGMALKFVTKATFTPEDLAAAPELEPALESLLRSLEVHDSVIEAMRINEILDRAIFSDLAQDEGKMRKCAAAFGIDQSDDADFPHQREMAKLLGAWRTARTQNEVKLNVDAAAKAHGEPIAILAMDWNSLMVQFKAKYGTELCEEDLPAQTYFEEFEERLAEGSLEAERLGQVVSQEEAELKRKNKPDPARQYGMHLNGTLTLQTRRRFTSSEPCDIEQLRAKYTVMENLWLLAQVRQPGRAIYKDLTPTTFSNFLKVLLNKRNFNFKKEVDGQLLTQPSWSHCLSYEYELRKEAGRKCRTMSMGIAAALKSTYEDNEHRTQHWVQLVAIANSSKENDAKVARLEREVQELRSMVGRSRSPRLQPRQKALPAPAQQLALPAPASRTKPQRQSGRNFKRGSGKGSGKGKGKSASQGGASSSSSSGLNSFNQIMKMGWNYAFSLFHDSNRSSPICCKFQGHTCQDPSSCNRRHVCIGCATEGKPYNDCHCLQSKLN